MCNTLKKRTLPKYNLKKNENKTGYLVLGSGCLSHTKKQKHLKKFENEMRDLHS